MAVLLETTLGDIVIDLYTEERPKASLNFLKLCKIKYYNYCLIHNVQKDFIIQTGDPTGTGRGGESVFWWELFIRSSIERKGPSENLDYLDGVHTVFGEVTEGLDVLSKINETFVDNNFIPYQDIRINHTVILDDPFDDPAGLPIPDRSPEPTKEQLDSGRIGADEVIDDEEGRDAEKLDEKIKDKEAKTQAILLEMVGDLPDADIKPPENVLFVCKLNPVTTDEDLEIIFSRFGPIKCCEIIRDWKTEESLCYAFIEFEKVEDCEKAFFKMDNVLIDDRRIHVDFSQSVSKIKWKGKGGKYTKEDFKAYEKDLDNKSKLALKDNVKTKQDSRYELLLDEDEDERRKDDREKRERKRHSDERPKDKKSKDRDESRREKDKGRQGWDKGREKEKQRERGRERDSDHKRYRRDRSRSRSPKRSKY
uniref:Peptidyl-prolyl cis-trans isomerase n=1 Tax=Cyprinus carpio TaxID=7962 RepID=A0A8C2IV59_CYPCA